MDGKIMDELIGAVKDRMGAGYTVEAQEIEKDNGVEHPAVAITGPAGMVSSVVYIDGMEADIRAGAIDIQDAAGRIVQAHQDSGYDEVADTIQHLDKEYILQNVICQMVWREKYVHRLQDMPHEDVLDLSVIYRVYLGGGGDVAVSIAVTYPFCRTYGIDGGELRRCAERNTEGKGSLTRSVASILAEAIGIPEMEDGPIPPLWVLCTQTGSYGASVLLYKEPFDRLAERYGSDLYVIPSSIHEVLAVPTRGLAPEERAGPSLDDNGVTAARDSISGDGVYVLYGYWDTLEEKDAMVIRVSLEPETVMEELDRIAAGRASAYIELYGDLREERGEGYYEVMDASCRYARFYIKEMQVEHDDPDSTGTDIDLS